MDEQREIILRRMAATFDEWARRYAENPSNFDSVLDDKGNIVPSYGMRCAIYFDALARELDESGRLERLN